MPKYSVYVERMVPQWINVVVECDDASDIEHSEDVKLEIFDAACQRDGWKYDDDSPRARKPSTVQVVESDVDEERDLRIHNPEVPERPSRVLTHNEKIMRYLDVNGPMSARDVADAVCGGMREKVESLAFNEAKREDGPRWEAVAPAHGGTGVWYAMVGDDRGVQAG